MLLAYHAIRKLLILLQESRGKAPAEEEEGCKNGDIEGVTSVQDVVEDISDCIAGINQTRARLAVLEALYASLFATSQQIRVEPTSGIYYTFHLPFSQIDNTLLDPGQPIYFIAQANVVSPILRLISSSLADIPDSQRKFGLTELVEEAQWRFDLIQSFSRSSRGHALGSAGSDTASSVIALMSATPDGLAANTLRINGTA